MARFGRFRLSERAERRRSQKSHLKIPVFPVIEPHVEALQANRAGPQVPRPGVPPGSRFVERRAPGTGLTVATLLFREWVSNLSGRAEVLLMRRSRFQVRPLGGGSGCLGMILVSIIASIVLTVLLNLILNLLN